MTVLTFTFKPFSLVEVLRRFFPKPYEGRHRAGAVSTLQLSQWGTPEVPDVWVT